MVSSMAVFGFEMIEWDCSSKIMAMPAANLRRIFLVAGIVSLFVAYVGIWMRMINDPVERTGADFIHFYSAGRIAQSHGSAHVYNLVLQHDVEEEQVGFPLAERQVLPYNHLPFLIPILKIAVNTDYVASFYRWVLIMLLIYAAGIALYGRSLKQAGIETGFLRVVQVGGLLFLPVFFSLMNGQDTALLFLGAAIWVYGLLAGRPLLAGLGLSLTSVRPHLALALALPMLFHRRKVFLGFLLGGGTLGLISFSILGIAGTKEFINMLLLSVGGDWYGLKQPYMFNLIGALLRVLPWIAADAIRTMGWIIYALTIVGLCILWARARDPRNGLIGLTVTLALFVAPHLHFHDLALLLIPIYEWIRSSSESGGLKRSIAIMLPIAISLLLLISNISPYLQYTIPYVVMFVLAGYPYRKRFQTLLTRPHQS
jgi:hypothetical protein